MYGKFKVIMLVDERPFGFLTSAEYAKSVGVSKNTIRVWIMRGKLESLKIGNEHWIRYDTKPPVRKKKI